MRDTSATVNDESGTCRQWRVSYKKYGYIVRGGYSRNKYYEIPCGLLNSTRRSRHFERKLAKNISTCTSLHSHSHSLSLGLGLTASPILALSGTITGSRKPLFFAHSTVRSSPLMRCVSCAVKVLVANSRLNFCQSFPAARNIFVLLSPGSTNNPPAGGRGSIVGSNKKVRGKKMRRTFVKKGLRSQYLNLYLF